MSARFSITYLCSCNLCLLVVLALFHVCFTNQNFDDVLCMDRERQALLQFKHGLIDETDRLASWDDGEESDCCRWAGIACDNITGHVRKIHLPGLDGHCPDGAIMATGVYQQIKETSKQKLKECWENWTGLDFLNLENNCLSGGIPRALGALRHLRSLNLHGNKLSGRVLDSLMNLTSLETLQLGRNELVGSIPTWFGTTLSSLKILNLGSNHFDGNIPDELCYLKDIQILDLDDNNLSGNIPACINNFSVLTGEKTISLDPFRFYSPLYMKFIHGSVSLVMKGREDTYKSILSLVILLDLSNNNFSGNVPSEIVALRELKTLNFSRNRLTGRIPQKIGDMKALETFDLSLNQLSGELPSSLSRLNFLGSFNVSYNNLTGRVPSSTQLQSFNESSFFGNKLCGPPLIDNCLRVETPKTDTDQEEGYESHGVDWGFIISMVFGFTVGFWIVMGPLIFSRTWRITYFCFLTKLRYMVYNVMHKYCFNVFPK